MAIKLDDSLLEELGLGALPEAEKKPFLRQLYEELEKRVGTRLAAGMSDEQISQFERFATGDIEYAKSYLDSNVANWMSLPDYASMYQERQAAATRAGAEFNEMAVVAEYAAFKWLETNFPNYKDVVAEEFDKLKVEIKGLAPQIMASSGQQVAPTAAPVAPQSFAPAPAAAPQPGQDQQPPTAA